MTKGLQCIIGQFQTRSAIWKFSNVRESMQQSKEWIDFFSYVECFRSELFQYGFLEEHKVLVNTCMLILNSYGG